VLAQYGGGFGDDPPASAPATPRRPMSFSDLQQGMRDVHSGKVDDSGFRNGVLPYTVPQDLAGLPTCAVPVGFDDRHLPVAVQVTGPPRSEARVLTVAEALFSATASARAGFASTR